MISKLHSVILPKEIGLKGKEIIKIIQEVHKTLSRQNNPDNRDNIITHAELRISNFSQQIQNLIKAQAPVIMKADYKKTLKLIDEVTKIRNIPRADIETKDENRFKTIIGNYKTDLENQIKFLIKKQTAYATNATKAMDNDNTRCFVGQGAASPSSPNGSNYTFPVTFKFNK